MAEVSDKHVHCAMLGDGMVGKTCLTLSYTEKSFTDTYTATVFDNYPGEYLYHETQPPLNLSFSYQKFFLHKLILFFHTSVKPLFHAY